MNAGTSCTSTHASGPCMRTRNAKSVCELHMRPAQALLITYAHRRPTDAPGRRQLGENVTYDVESAAAMQQADTHQKAA